MFSYVSQHTILVSMEKGTQLTPVLLTTIWWNSQPGDNYYWKAGGFVRRTWMRGTPGPGGYFRMENQCWRDPMTFWWNS